MASSKNRDKVFDIGDHASGKKTPKARYIDSLKFSTL